MARREANPRREGREARETNGPQGCVCVAWEGAYRGPETALTGLCEATHAGRGGEEAGSRTAGSRVRPLRVRSSQISTHAMGAKRRSSRYAKLFSIPLTLEIFSKPNPTLLVKSLTQLKKAAPYIGGRARLLYRSVRILQNFTNPISTTPPSAFLS